MTRFLGSALIAFLKNDKNTALRLFNESLLMAPYLNTVNIIQELERRGHTYFPDAVATIKKMYNEFQ